MDDLDTIAIGQYMPGMRAARDEFAVDYDGDSATDFEVHEQLADGLAGRRSGRPAARGPHR
jgi:hypothetical protein